MTASGALYSLAEIRAIESAALAALPPATLMQRAGQAAAATALELAQAASGEVLVLAGPGNNGGDALEAAYHLAQAGLQVCVLLLADPARQSPDARLALARARSVPLRFEDPGLIASLPSSRWSLVIDGLYGIGLTRPIQGEQRALAKAVNAMRCPVLALDIPSGLNADTGAIVGPDGIALRATHTITFIGDKPGLHTGHGRDVAGQVRVDRLGINDACFAPAHARLNQPELFGGAARRRPHASHKGSYGDVAVIGGAHGLSGAPILAARAAIKCGAGRVYAGFLEQALPYDSGQPELMCRLARDLDLTKATLVVGPGLGTSSAAREFLETALAAGAPLVLDADALNLIALEPELQQKLAQRREPSLLTPHPLEAARLLGSTNAAIQDDRPAAARELARRFNAIALLKGSGTVIARPGGDIVINTTGNPGLATAGSGDVLAGVCGALLAQHWPAWEAALAAVWLHGKAADELAGQAIGPVGLTATELIPCVRTLLNRLIEEHGH